MNMITIIVVKQKLVYVSEYAVQIRPEFQVLKVSNGCKGCTCKQLYLLFKVCGYILDFKGMTIISKYVYLNFSYILTLSTVIYFNHLSTHPFNYLFITLLILQDPIPEDSGHNDTIQTICQPITFFIINNNNYYIINNNNNCDKEVSLEIFIPENATASV